ncbi:hypothetical protein CRYPA_1942 [uncultured Candidatus Thioglobus sp.]|nr:hypothetical protein CRYPA_1942 [uncultured Candidatus Thioglobus sp.]
MMSLATLDMVKRSKQIKIEKLLNNIAPVLTDDDLFASGELFKGKVYLTVTSPDTGRVWLDRNLGATQVATSSTDSAAYGDLYQWGRATDGHQSRTLDVAGSNSTNETTNTTMTQATTITPADGKFIKNNTTPFDWTTAGSSNAAREAAWADGGANDICPAGFSVPTIDELIADTVHDGTYTGSNDITNSATAFTSFLKLPVVGDRSRSNGALGGVGSFASLWSRSANGSDARRVGFSSGGASISSNYRAVGLSVRCIGDQA